MTTFTRADYEAAATHIQQHTDLRPEIGMILGSGLGDFADSVENPTIIPYADIPNWPSGAVKGHAKRLVVGHLEGKPVAVMQGRAHFYEGYSMQAVGFPVRVMQMMGIKKLVVTNAAGGINQDFSAGDLMIIKDHIFMPGMTGQNPLMGPNDESLGPRFPIMTTAYDRELRELALAVAERESLHLQQGVYLSLSGPAFETPAEIRMQRAWGADAVGMSTAPEVMVAVHGGMRVLGISSIANVSIDDVDSTQDVSHEEVLEVGQSIVPRLVTLLRGILRDLPN